MPLGAEGLGVLVEARVPVQAVDAGQDEHVLGDLVLLVDHHVLRGHVRQGGRGH